jgi:hypothetical protein
VGTQEYQRLVKAWVAHARHRNQNLAIKELCNGHNDRLSAIGELEKHSIVIEI